MSDGDVRFEQLHLGPPIGRGGEATVHSLTSDANNLVKLYHRPDSLRAAKLGVMIAAPPSRCVDDGRVVIAWPTRRVFSRTSERSVIGFIMPRVVGGEPASTLHNMRSRLTKAPHFHWRYLVRASRNISTLISRVHAAGYVVGDLNDGGILIDSSAVAALVDCDSFQVKDPSSSRTLRCTVGMGLFTPPELAGANFGMVDRTIAHDAFGLAVVSYLLLMGSHPFLVRLPEQDEQLTVEDAINRGLYPDGSVAKASPSKVSVPYGVLPPAVRLLFRRAFGTAASRPAPDEWVHALDEMDRGLRTCSRNSNHVYAGHLLGDCPWCDRTAVLSGRDPFPSALAIKQGLHVHRKQPHRRWVPPQTPAAPPPPHSVAPKPPPISPSSTLSPRSTHVPAPAKRTVPPVGDIARLAVRRAAIVGAWGLLGIAVWFPVIDNAWRAVGAAAGLSWAATLASYGASCFALALAYSLWLARQPPQPAGSPSPHSLPTQPSAGARSVPGAAQSAQRGWGVAEAVVGSRNRNKFHRPGCEWARKIGGRNRVTFASPQEAVQRGYRPCQVCRP